MEKFFKKEKSYIILQLKINIFYTSSISLCSFNYNKTFFTTQNIIKKTYSPQCIVEFS